MSDIYFVSPPVKRARFNAKSFSQNVYWNLLAVASLTSLIDIMHQRFYNTFLSFPHCKKSLLVKVVASC